MKDCKLNRKILETLCRWSLYDFSTFCFAEDEFKQIQAAEDLVKILIKGTFLEDILGRQQFKNILEIIGRDDLAASK